MMLLIDLDFKHGVGKHLNDFPNDQNFISLFCHTILPCHAQFSTVSSRIAFCRFVSLRFASRRFARYSNVPLRFAPRRFARQRWVPLKSAPLRLAWLRLALTKLAR